MAQSRAIGPPPVSRARCSPVRSSYQRGDITQVYLPSKFALLRPGDGRLVPGMMLVNRVAQRIVRDERLTLFPVVVVRASQENADLEVDVHEIVGDDLAVDDRRPA